MKYLKIGHIAKTIFITIIFLILFFGGYNLIFFNKITPNTYFGALNISGRDSNSVQNIVSNLLDNYKNISIELVVGSQTFDFTLEELGIEIQNDISIKDLNDNAKLTSIFDLRKSLSSLISSRVYKPHYIINTNIYIKKINSTFETFELKPVNSTISLNDDQIIIVQSKKGLMIDRSDLLTQIKSRIDNLSQNSITTQYIEIKPNIETSQVNTAFKKVELLSEQDLTLKYEFDSWNFNGKQLLDLLSFELSGNSGDQLASIEINEHFITLESISYINRKIPMLDVGVNENSLTEIVNEMSLVIDKPTIDASLEFDGVKVSRFTPAQDGRSLDKSEIRKILQNMFDIDNLNYDSNVVINLPVIETKAKIANEKINSLGITELIASGVSYFQGSIPNRAFNIGFGSEFINGTVVPPGEIFSFNKLVGPVSGEQGFKQAYVINKGRTVLDDGGGICQVSTTVFRAALNAGLPIIERTAHAYRVTYYEQRGFEPGYDATIWSPTVDLKFKNDTGHHILVQITVDSSISKLQVDIYGTSDGRTVELTSPIVTNRRPAPDALYQDDPTLPIGTIKQVDWAAAGLTSIFDRTVIRDGEIIIDESFTSNFRPWQAVYLVGTGS